MEQVKKAETPLTRGKSTKGMKTKGPNIHVTNTNWTKSITKWWEAVNIVSLNKMLEVKPPMPVQCTSAQVWRTSCVLALVDQGLVLQELHVGATMVSQVHVLLDACPSSCQRRSYQSKW